MGFVSLGWSVVILDKFCSLLPLVSCFPLISDFWFCCLTAVHTTAIPAGYLCFSLKGRGVKEQGGGSTNRLDLQYRGFSLSQNRGELWGLQELSRVWAGFWGHSLYKPRSEPILSPRWGCAVLSLVPQCKSWTQMEASDSSQDAVYCTDKVYNSCGSWVSWLL